MQIEKTNRGFSILKFKDSRGEHCSLQESSAATETCIWLGVDNPKPQILSAGKWVEVPLPTGTLLSGRMHLNKDQVKELLPYLQRFVETAELGEP